MFELVAEFENKVAEYYGAPYAVATDSCTHGLELCIRHQSIKRLLYLLGHIFLFQCYLIS